MTRIPARALLLVIIYLGFISMGLPDGALGVAWPQMHVSLALPVGVAGMLTFASTLLAGVAGLSSGRVLARFKTGPVVLVSCALTSTGMLLISQAQSLAWLLAASVPLGLGAGAVDAALNGYVARHFSGRHMNWLHACWGMGATCGPILMAQALGTAGGWLLGYLVLGAVQLTLIVVFLFTLKLWYTVPERIVHDAAAHAGSIAVPVTPANSLVGWLSVATFVILVAVETTTGLWASSILVLARGIPEAVAGACTGIFYGSITGGRIVVGIVVDRRGARRLIAIGTTTALVGGVVFALAHHPLQAAAGLMLIGVGCAPVYPCLMHEVPRRFSPAAVPIVIGRQTGAASLGAALLPAAAGWLAQFHLESIPWVLIAAILVLLATARWLNRISETAVSVTGGRGASA